MACLARFKLLKRLFGHEPEPVEGLDMTNDGLDTTDYIAERLLRQKDAYQVESLELSKDEFDTRHNGQAACA